MYGIVGQDLSLLSIKRMDYGRLSEATLRYPQDAFDRLWPNGAIGGLIYRNTTNSFSSEGKFEIPSAVLQTALVTPNNSVGNITWSWSVEDIGKYYFVICFAEVEQLGANASAMFALNHPRGLCLPSYSYSSSFSFSSHSHSHSPFSRSLCSPTPLGIRAPSHNLFFGFADYTATRYVKLGMFWKESERPSSVEMEAISAPEQFDQLLAQPQPFVIDWMANWCRKCIYLKPKLEKLAAEFYPTIKFYYVDVNDVPQALVKRGGVSKMPTIQMWKNGEMQGEVIGGHKAWLVVDEVRDMIKKTLTK